MNTEQRKLALMVGVYGASAAFIAEKCNEMVDRQANAYQPRKMGLHDQQIADQKGAALKATERNLRSIKLLDPVAAKLVNYEALELITHRRKKPAKWQGAHSFRSSGDFTGIAAVGFV